MSTGNENDPTVVISARGEARLRAGHPWVYRSDVAVAHAGGGEVVRLLGPRARRLGRAFYSGRSEIALRHLGWEEPAPERAFWEARLEAALAWRERLEIDGDAWRLVHAEGDRLPSLIVDRYADWLVVQALSQGADRLLPLFSEVLRARLAPTGILARHDGRVRQLEGLAQEVRVLHGTVPPIVTVRLGPVRYEVDLRTGQKTGLFLDQRENHEAAVRYARGRLLDCFSYHGGFALRLAPACERVVAVEASEEASLRLTRNAALNGIPLEVRTANVFDELRELERSRASFDTIVLDPPAFAKNRASIPRALAGYKEINLRAIKLLAPAGHLVTCSCSHHVDEPMLLDVVRAAAADARAPLAVVEKRMQARDHPVLVGVPETQYLKCLILRRLV